LFVVDLLFTISVADVSMTSFVVSWFDIVLMFAAVVASLEVPFFVVSLVVALLFTLFFSNETTTSFVSVWFVAVVTFGVV